MKASEIRPFEKNAKQHPNKQLRQIAESINEFGWRQSIVVDKKGVIVVGHGRWLAWVKFKDEMGLPEPVIEVADDLSKDQIRAYRLADNKLNESDWDMELAIEELKELPEELFELTGFDADEIIDIAEDDFNAEEEYKKIKTPKTKIGDIYQLGEHRIMCGDAIKEDDMEKLMGGKLARLIFTDPPYNVDYKSQSGNSYSEGKYGDGNKIFNDKKNDEECLNFYIDSLKNLYEFTTDDACIYWWLAFNSNGLINLLAFKETGWKMSQQITWIKDRFVFSRGQDYHRASEPCFFGWKQGKSHFTIKKRLNNMQDYILLGYNEINEMSDIWFENRDNIKEYEHPTQKPVRLSERAIKKNSEEDDIILDVFGGSGSTLIGCEQLKRKCYIMELDPKYCDVIVGRWERFSAKKANN